LNLDSKWLGDAATACSKREIADSVLRVSRRVLGDLADAQVEASAAVAA